MLIVQKQWIVIDTQIKSNSTTINLFISNLYIFYLKFFSNNESIQSPRHGEEFEFGTLVTCKLGGSLTLVGCQKITAGISGGGSWKHQNCHRLECSRPIPTTKASWFAHSWGKNGRLPGRWTKSLDLWCNFHLKFSLSDVNGPKDSLCILL